jgi:hypothetical protein
MDDLRGDKPETRNGSSGKILAAFVVAGMIAAIGAYTFETGMWNSPPKQQVVADKDLPRPSSPLDTEPSRIVPTQNEPAQPTQNPPATPQTPPATPSTPQ